MSSFPNFIKNACTVSDWFSKNCWMNCAYSINTLGAKKKLTFQNVQNKTTTKKWQKCVGDNGQKKICTSLNHVQKACKVSHWSVKTRRQRCALQILSTEGDRIKKRWNHRQWKTMFTIFLWKKKKKWGTKMRNFCPFQWCGNFVSGKKRENLLLLNAKNICNFNKW